MALSDLSNEKKGIKYVPNTHGGKVIDCEHERESSSCFASAEIITCSCILAGKKWRQKNDKSVNKKLGIKNKNAKGYQIEFSHNFFF